MIRKMILCSIIALMATGAGARQSKGEKEFVGTINNTLRIRIKLTESNGKYQGTYLYEKVGKDLRLSGASRGEGEFYLNEFDESGKKTGIFEGRFISEDWIEGTWAPGQNKKAMSFSAWNASGKDVPAESKDDRISGQYKRVDAQGREDRHTAVINIWLLKSGRVRIMGYSSWVGNIETGNVNAGNVDGIFNLDGKRMTYSGVDGDDSCRLAVLFGADSLTVTDDNGECGGHNVTFNGKYRRVGPPKSE